MFRSVAAAGSTELFVAAALFVAVGSGLVTAAAGLSMALGAFVAGLLLSETEYHRAIEATIDPFKGLLLGVFFFSVGMSLDVAYLWNNPLPILIGLVGLIAIKAGVLIGLLRLFRVPWQPTIETAALLGPGGEFAFIVIGLAVLKDIVGAGRRRGRARLDLVLHGAGAGARLLRAPLVAYRHRPRSRRPIRR